MIIPTLLGRPVNQHETDILELPVRCGRLGIINPVRITSCEVLHKESDHQLKDHLEQAREKGTSTWLSTLLLKDLNYVLNNQEFQDSIRLRYGWKIQELPSKLAYGNVNSILHALGCKLGGYASMRHNAIRDTAAFFL